jgi:hypothetical protein
VVLLPGIGRDLGYREPLGGHRRSIRSAGQRLTILNFGCARFDLLPAASVAVISAR